MTKIRYIGAGRRIKRCTRVKYFGVVYVLQERRKRKFLGMTLWKDKGWCYPSMFTDYEQMKVYLEWDTQINYGDGADLLAQR